MFMWLRRFMYGRYGVDKLNIFLIIVGVILSIVAGFFFRPLYILADVFYVYAFFRALSRNIPARQRENATFYRLYEPVAKWFGFQKRKFKERKVYKYFRCPKCHQQLRAPRGRGKIEVTCQKCGNVFRTKA